MRVHVATENRPRLVLISSFVCRNSCRSKVLVEILFLYDISGNSEHIPSISFFLHVMLKGLSSVEPQGGNLQSDLRLVTNQVSVRACVRLLRHSGFATFTAAHIRGGGQLEGSVAYIAAGHMG